MSKRLGPARAEWVSCTAPVTPLGLRGFSLSNRPARLSSQILCEGLIELEEQLALRDALIAFETLN
jgi:hypothetical protein